MNIQCITSIKIFYKLSGGTNQSMTFPSNTATSPYVNRKLRIFVEPENLSRPFEFEINFKIFRNRTYNMRTNISNSIRAY